MQAARGATLSDSRGLARVSLLVAGVILILDQLTKYLAVAHLEGQPPIQLIGEWLKLNFTRNPGAAFSLGGQGYTAIITVIAAAICIVIVRSSRKLGSIWWAVFLGGMLGGALGNLIDRFFRSPGVLRGHVVDFLQLPNWPIFNVADMAIVGSAIGMVVLSLFGIEMDGTRHRRGEPDSGSEAGAGPDAGSDTGPDTGSDAGSTSAADSGSATDSGADSGGARGGA